MSGMAKLGLAFLVVGALIAAMGGVLFPKNDLIPVDQPVRIEAGKTHSAHFVAQFSWYEIGISTKRGLVLANRCPAARDVECVSGPRAFFADRCVDGSPILELSALVKADGQAVPILCRSFGEPYHWQELWRMEAEPGQEYELEVTVAGGDPQLQQFEPTFRVRAEKDIRKEKAVEQAYTFLCAGFVGALGGVLLISSLVWSRLRPKASRSVGRPRREKPRSGEGY